MPTDPGQFREELINEARLRAAADPHIPFTDQAFAVLVGERLVEAEELGSFEPCHVRQPGPRNTKMKLDGFEWDEDDDSLRLIVAKFVGAPEPEAINRAAAEVEFKAVRAFIDASVSGWCKRSLEPACDGFRLAADIQYQASAKNISRIRVFLVTDGVLSERMKDSLSSEGDIAGIPIEYRIWDTDRLYAVAQSTMGREAIEVDFSDCLGGGVPILEVATDSTHYRGYLGQIPGEVLANIYDRYGSRLLEGNVRAFLSARGKVNKGIQKTIAEQPEMFFAFNNGIATTASDVKIKPAPGTGLLLTSATNLQIVNGGQTTASLAFARRKSKANLGRISVAMKLSVVTEARAVEITPLISRYANSQNKVSDADLWSNHAFHRRIEEISRRILAPAGTLQFQTHWYYERSRGQYQSDIVRCPNASAKRHFEQSNPKSQIISKELLAKMENAWLLNPHLVCMGGQKNFLRFAKETVAAWEKDDSQFNEIFFRRLVAKILLHRAAEVVAITQNPENRTIKAHIATYALAAMSQLLTQSRRDAPWDLFWREQSIPSDWIELLGRVVSLIAPIMKSTDTEATILTEWFKKEVLWTRIRMRLERFEMPKDLRSISASESRDAVVEGQKNQAIAGSLDEMNFVLALGMDGWDELVSWLAANPITSAPELRTVQKFASRRGAVPSEVEARTLCGLFRRAVSNGFKPNHPSARAVLPEIS